ncbi:unnamed protein product [Protopolystoma xenopodis]|uniref:C2H2-type domain-containing protein n=1 Tax=Protopolystoma xenopodis TaxID=117903 RepID=A0A448WAQ9_9PLAT|nr:unnamed protein product [Protopolystoma xenopodis]
MDPSSKLLKTNQDATNSPPLLDCVSGGAKRFICPICQYAFGKKSLLDRHAITHAKIKPFVCQMCNRGFTQCFTLKKHMELHSNPNYVECAQCNRVFNSSVRLNKHIQQEHNCIPDPVPASEDKDPSNIDGMLPVILQQSPLIRRRKSKPYTPFKCHLCNRSFSSASFLYFHKRVHKYGQARPLKWDHQTEKLSTVPVGITCPNGRLPADMPSSHLPNRPFKCPSCSNAYKYCPHLQFHIRQRHLTGQTLHPCDICGRKYLKHSNLNRHVTSKHSGPISSQKQTCSTCGIQLSSKLSLKRHLSLHSDERAFFCPICQARFKSRNACRLHIQKHSLGERMEPTDANGSYCQPLGQGTHLMTADETKAQQDVLSSSCLPFEQSNINPAQSGVNQKQDILHTCEENSAYLGEILDGYRSHEAVASDNTTVTAFQEGGSSMMHTLLATDFASSHILASQTLDIDGIQFGQISHSHAACSADFIPNHFSVKKVSTGPDCVDSEHSYNDQPLHSIDISENGVPVHDSIPFVIESDSLAKGLTLDESSSENALSFNSEVPKDESLHRLATNYLLGPKAIFSETVNTMDSVDLLKFATVQDALTDPGPSSCKGYHDTSQLNGLYSGLSPSLQVDSSKEPTEVVDLNVVSHLSDDSSQQSVVLSLFDSNSSCSEKLFGCSRCDAVFADSQHLKLHTSRNHGLEVRPYVCPYCHRTFINLVAFINHQVAHEAASSIVNEEGQTTNDNNSCVSFVCPICSHTFSTQALLTFHASQDHPSVLPTPYRCSHCRQTFKSIRTLKSHIDEIGQKTKRISTSDRSKALKKTSVKHSTSVVSSVMPSVTRTVSGFRQRRIRPRRAYSFAETDSPGDLLQASTD